MRGLSCRGNVSGSCQFCTDLSNTTSSTSLWGSQNSQITGVRSDQKEIPYGQILNAANLRVFTLAELKAATKNFRDDTVLGEGGFGRVYKGFIKERGEVMPIAVKKLISGSSWQGAEEWQKEVNFLGRLSHPNLIKLLGFGQEDSELFLVYEFMQRGSFDNHLYGRGANIQPLSWDTRLKTYTAKLSDFGLARYGPSGDETHVTTRVMGTGGYAAPEYVATGHLYVKSDVYGFGIILVEMLTAKKIRDIMPLGQQKFLLDWLKSNLLNRGKMRRTMDAKLEGKYPPNLASQVAQLTLKCLQEDPKIRPSMQQVVETLEQIEAANDKPANNNNRNRARALQRHGQPDDG
ncbi:Serine-threonine/tyrosine-protein kinase, catalytic domain [Sesbania bispinosa]|nr:Serine-threonine/tyrosine-protein kinase, catalytic domain [Sesbania bispinosa]